MTSPRSTYGGGYRSTPSFADTPIYDSLVAERGTPQIAPIRVSAPFDGGSQLPALPALPSAPAAPQPPVAPQAQQPGYAAHTPPYGYQAPAAPQPPGLQQAPAPYIPQQAAAPRGYPGAQPYQQRPVSPASPSSPSAGPSGAVSTSPSGFEAMRPVAPRPAPAPYEDPYQRPYQGQGGY
ncbi:DUF6643 family protein [Streptomyces gamaensis]|uniref:DUF6643 family protein n=1 Tax=Streptomyces gamaensis TaxID=1763542 RepID=A0ABW0Z2I5_9ACTN